MAIDISEVCNFPAENLSDFRHGVFISGFFTKLSQIKTNQIYDSLARKSFISPTAKKTFQESLKLVKKCSPKFACYQVNVRLIQNQSVPIQDFKQHFVFE